jgi:hydrogenase maturation protease
MPTARAELPSVLIAGLGNIFLGDDAFGVEVVRRLSAMQVPEQVRLVDVGIRTVHLAYELRETAYDTVILLDAIARGGTPGTLYVLEPEEDDAIERLHTTDGHAVYAHQVAVLVRQLGGQVGRVRIVGCEPSQLGPDAGLSPAVASAVDAAVQLVSELIASTPGGAAMRM